MPKKRKMMKPIWRNLSGGPIHRAEKNFAGVPRLYWFWWEARLDNSACPPTLLISLCWEWPLCGTQKGHWGIWGAQRRRRRLLYSRIAAVLLAPNVGLWSAYFRRQQTQPPIAPFRHFVLWPSLMAHIQLSLFISSNTPPPLLQWKENKFTQALKIGEQIGIKIKDKNIMLNLI